MYSTSGLRVFLVLFLGGISSADAQLKWSTLEQVVRPAAGASDTECEFLFLNEGKEPVTIVKVQPSCSCISSTLDQTTYAPGQSGVLRVHYHVAGMRGRQTKTIAITTQPEEVRQTTLRITAELTEAYSVAPRMLHWKIGESASEQTVICRVHPDAESAVPRIGELTEGFHAVIEPSSESERAYTIRVSPDTTSEKKRGVILLQFKGTGGSPVGFRIVLIVE